MSAVLHWGCGDVVADGMVNSDRDNYGQEHVGDIRDGLPWAPAAFGYVVSHHALQMLPWAALVHALAELRRVTMPGGWLRLSVPDILAAIDAYDAGDTDHFQIDPSHEPSLDGAFCMYVTQAGATRSIFTAGWLIELCGRAGWADPHQAAYAVTGSPWPGIVSLDTRRAESVFVEATAA